MRRVGGQESWRLQLSNAQTTGEVAVADLRFIHYEVKRGARVTAAYEKALAARTQLSPLAGYWNVDVGPLNCAVELFCYQDAAQRGGVRALAAALPDWPPTCDGLVVGDREIHLEAAPFNPPLTPGIYGSMYELRRYDYERQHIAEVLEKWSEIIDGRAALSPFLGVWYSTAGEIASLFQFWAYGGTADRERVRLDMQRPGIWPPLTSCVPTQQESMLLIPTAFSPLR